MNRSTLIDIHTHHATDARTIRTAGIHPWKADELVDAELAALEAAAKAGEIDAIGEIGLDFACRADRSLQLVHFRQQLDLAERFGLPVVLHVVRSFDEVVIELQERHLAAVILHGFIGSPQQATRAVRAGYYLSFGERSLRSARTIGSMRKIPLSRLFVETDESLTPIEAIYARVAEVRGLTPDALAQAVTANYERIFGIQ